MILLWLPSRGQVCLVRSESFHGEFIHPVPPAHGAVFA